MLEVELLGQLDVGDRRSVRSRTRGTVVVVVARAHNNVILPMTIRRRHDDDNK